MVKTTIHVEPEIWLEVRKRALELGISAGEYVNRILRKAVLYAPKKARGEA